MIAFESCMYLLAGFAVLTGSLDLALGMKGQKNLGARLTDEGFADPLLNSQFRYLGTMWLGFGAALFLCLSDLPRYVVLFQGLIASIFQFGIPMPRAGRNLVIWATAFELIGSPLFIWWQHQVMAQS